MNRSAVSTLVLALGAITAIAGLLADAVGLSRRPGFGKSQWLAIAAGVVAIALATLWSVPRRNAVRDWLRRAGRDAALGGPPGGLRLGLGLGLLLGLIEVVHLLGLKYGSSSVLKLPVHFVWMVPAVYVAGAAVVGFALGCAALALRSLLSLPVVMFGFGAVTAWSQLIMHPWLDKGAVLLVCLGAGVQLARVSLARAASIARRLRWAPWAALGLPALGAAAALLAQTSAERRARDALGPAPAAAPNVLLLVLDTVRADHLSSYGYPRATTPNIDALAANGVAFDWLISTAPWTLPSHAAMFTGRYHRETSADWLTALDGVHPTLAELMSTAGYATAGFVGNINYCCAAQGLDRGFSRYEDFPVTAEVAAFCTSLGKNLVRDLNFFERIRNDAAWLTDRFLAWADGVRDRPFFAFVNFFDAHGLYIAPPAYATKFGPRSPLIEQWYAMRTWQPAEMQGFVDAYDGCLAFIDHEIGRLVDALRQRGMLDNTVILVTSDHGEQFGEHGLKDHSNSLYAQLLRLPLVVSWPGRVPAGRRITDMVSLRDLPATILDLAGVQPRQPWPGHSLAPLWRAPSGDAPRSAALAGITAAINRPAWEPASKGDMNAVVADGMHLIVNGDGREELYDLRTDPNEVHDLRATPDGEAAAARLRAMLPR